MKKLMLTIAFAAMFTIGLFGSSSNAYAECDVAILYCAPNLLGEVKVTAFASDTWVDVEVGGSCSSALTTLMESLEQSDWFGIVDIEPGALGQVIYYLTRLCEA